MKNPVGAFVLYILSGQNVYAHAVTVSVNGRQGLPTSRQESIHTQVFMLNCKVRTNGAPLRSEREIMVKAETRYSLEVVPRNVHALHRINFHLQLKTNGSPGAAHLAVSDVLVATLASYGNGEAVPIGITKKIYAVRKITLPCSIGTY